MVAASPTLNGLPSCCNLLFFSAPLLLLLMLLLLLPPHASVSAEPVRLHGLNYNSRKGPDWDPDRCKTYAEIKADLSVLGRLTDRVRILSMTDCDQGELVWTVAKELGMRLWLGLWVGISGDTVFDDEVEELTRLLGVMDASDGTVLGVTVGSEVLYRKDATEEQMIQNMNRVYAVVKDAGLEGIVPVTICDVAPEYADSATLRAAVNVTFANTFPFWEGTDISGAVAELDADLTWLLSLPESQDKPFVLGETGWPSAGFIDGVGVAGPDEQKQYFMEAYCYLHVDKGWDYFWFNGIDDAWRQEQDPDNTIEGTWGFLYANMTVKDHFADLSFECSDGVTYSFAELDWTVPDGFTNPPATTDAAATCAAHPDCSSLGGNCCPNDEGIFLGCCDPDLVGPTIDPANNDTFVPTESPSEGGSSPTADGNFTTDAPTPAGTDESTSPPTSGDQNVPESPTSEPDVIDDLGSDSPSMTPTMSNETAPDDDDDSDSSPTPQPTIEGLQPAGSAFPPTRSPFSFADSNADTSGSSAMICNPSSPVSLKLSMALFAVVATSGWVTM